jgi:rhamnulokinase
VRLLRNVSGMWLLEECRRSWAQADGSATPIETLLSAAEQAPAHQAIFDVDAAALAAPGQDQDTIARHLVGRWDGSRGAVVRTILESLVTRLAQRAAELDLLLGAPRPTLHVVGGASRMALVMQWLADATDKTVIAGPAEATALGNALVQLRTLGAVPDIAAGRQLVARLPEVRRFTPRGDRTRWLQQAEGLAS